MIKRYYSDLSKHLAPNRVLVIYGPRRVGKTTLVETFLKQTTLRYKYDSGDNVSIHEILSSHDFSAIKSYLSGYDLYVLDEAQRVPEVGLALKIIVDQIPGIHVIATGSASFELAGQIGEPLTGRKRTIKLYPVSQLELAFEKNEYELKQCLDESLIYGGYPSVKTATTKEEKRIELTELVDSYLLKDVLELERIKNSKVLLNLLRLLAHQVGSQVSLAELAGIVGVDGKTVARYLDLLEKSFVIFQIGGYSSNLRNEISSKSKYYFFDLGVRNALINNLNDLPLRDDVGKLWENFCVIERLKFQEYAGLYANNYFWRTWEQQEVDWVEERGGSLFGYEFTFGDKKKLVPKKWQETYPDASFEVINRDNFLDFVTKK